MQRTEHSSTIDRYHRVRQQSESLCQPLETEDFVVQTMPDVSPAKWHLAHTTWFFETFVLGSSRDYKTFHPDFCFLFNSYYNAVGERQPRHQRGFLSRPSIGQVIDYRQHVDERMAAMLAGGTADDLLAVVEIGLHHEQQHQELMLTDIKHVLSSNPLRPVYRPLERPGHSDPPSSPIPPFTWLRGTAGLCHIGHDSDQFCFDNERPRHQVLLHGFEIADRLITNGEFLDFINDDAYQRPELWLADGWDAVQHNNWTCPLYWQLRNTSTRFAHESAGHSDNGWIHFTLAGMEAINPAEPVTHVSFFEADAFARWSGARLPTEFEWESIAATAECDGNFVESEKLRPVALQRSGDAAAPRQMFGDVWEWTSSQYLGYPGYRPCPGALGEYNGKFMCNQFVLRGGSCATPADHVRATYRNFFQPDKRWQFTGIRLARDVA